MPIATVENTTTFQAITADHLNTPRRVTSADGTLLWQWPYSAFGDEQPTVAAKRFASVPAVEGQFEFNLRYPGQYFDKESGLHYNGFRTYDPVTGRYTQGDPIGLDGGWNRFAYVGGNPLLYVDPEGLVRIYDNGNVTIHANPGVPIGGTEHARHGPGENYHVHVYDSQNREARISTETWRPLTPEDEKIYNSSKAMQKACEGLNDSEKKFFDRVNRQVFHRGAPTVNQLLRIGQIRGGVGRAALIPRGADE
jgi:RHS repeat-associated protein